MLWVFSRAGEIFLGGVFVLAGVLKLFAPEIFSGEIGAFVPFPPPMALWLACVLPLLEMVLGLCLLFGALRGPALLGIFGLCSVFFLILGRSILLGTVSSCGCFGGLETTIELALIRAALLAVGAGLLYACRGMTMAFPRE